MYHDFLILCREQCTNTKLRLRVCLLNTGCNVSLHFKNSITKVELKEKQCFLLIHHYMNQKSQQHSVVMPYNKIMFNEFEHSIPYELQIRH